jgi:hypothetical protein
MKNFSENLFLPPPLLLYIKNSNRQEACDFYRIFIYWIHQDGPGVIYGTCYP